MKATTVTTDVGAAAPSTGHLSVRIDSSHLDHAPFLFEQQHKRLGPAFIASFVTHIVVFLLAVLAVRFGASAANTAAVLPFQANSNIIWLSQPGPGGGGGGGGNRMQTPPRQAEEPGKDQITVPVTKPPKLEQPKQTAKEPDHVEQLNIPAKNLAAATESLPGAIQVLANRSRARQYGSPFAPEPAGSTLTKAFPDGPTGPAASPKVQRTGTRWQRERGSYSRSRRAAKRENANEANRKEQRGEENRLKIRARCHLKCHSRRNLASELRETLRISVQINWRRERDSNSKNATL